MAAAVAFRLWLKFNETTRLGDNVILSGCKRDTRDDHHDDEKQRKRSGMGRKSLFNHQPRQPLMWNEERKYICKITFIKHFFSPPFFLPRADAIDAKVVLPGRLAN